MAMSAAFRLSRILVIDVQAIIAVSQSGMLTTQEYTHSRSGQFYQCIRISQLLRIAKKI